MPYSKSEIDRLGDRLRKGDAPDETDLRQLQQVVGEYDNVRAEVARRISEGLGVEVTSRLKTVSTIIEKLKRERSRLSTVQDIAGVRLVMGPGVATIEQDGIVRRIGDMFPKHSIRDRRADPSSGYRAVHVVVKVEGRPVEVQVRTQMQDMWAQMFERVADQWGRGIRYGEEPEDPDAKFAGTSSRQNWVAALLEISKQIAAVERNDIAAREARSAVDALGSNIAEYEVVHEEKNDDLDEVKEKYLRVEAQLRQAEEAQAARRSELRSSLNTLATTLEGLFGRQDQ